MLGNVQPKTVQPRNPAHVSQSWQKMKPEGWAVLRVPACSEDEYLLLSAGLETPRALSEDSDPVGVKEAVRADLEKLWADLLLWFSNPDSLEALKLASEDLYSAFSEIVDEEDRSPEIPLRLAESLWRYAARMSTRSTPFGLFSSTSLATVKREIGDSFLCLGAREDCVRRSRLDTRWIMDLADEATKLLVRKRKGHLRPNSSLFKAGRRYQLAESRKVGNSLIYSSVSLDADEVLEDVLELAKNGMDFEELVDRTHSQLNDADIGHQDVGDFVASLVEEQILLPDVVLKVTSPHPFADLVDRLAAQLGAEDEHVQWLSAISTSIEKLDEDRSSDPCSRYGDLESILHRQPTSTERVGKPVSMVQVDLFRPLVEDGIPASAFSGLAEALEFLARFSSERERHSKAHQDLAELKRRFLERYHAGHWVPLAEVVDPEVGIGYGSTESGAVATHPLIGDLPNSDRVLKRQEWGPAFQALAAVVGRCLAEGRQEIHLGTEDIESLALEPLSEPVADSMASILEIIADSKTDLQNGRHKLLLKGTSGPGAGRLAARFCHLSPKLRELVQDSMEKEEALDPGFVHAEIVHLPQGIVGNVSTRPVTRSFEIRYLAESSKGLERQIEISDLLFTVYRGQAFLHSRSLNRLVLPRLTCAHNHFDSANLPLYRMLAAMQYQGRTSSAMWSWGPLAQMQFLPRVRLGRVILTRARWLVSVDEFEGLPAEEHSDTMLSLERWRRERGIPRKVVCCERDQELPIDFGNILSVLGLIRMTRRSGSSVLVESLESRWLQDKSGKSYRHELVVPWLATLSETPVCSPPPFRDEGQPSSASAALLPGSECLYVKLFCSSVLADRILVELILPFTKKAQQEGLFDYFFFIRYNQPSFHLRIRFFGTRENLWGPLLQALNSIFRTLSQDKILAKVELGSYRREVARYGGEQTIGLFEELFCHDSRATLEALRILREVKDETLRYLWCLASVDQWLQDFALPLPARASLLKILRNSFTLEHGAGVRLKKAIGRKYREFHPRLKRFAEIAPAHLEVAGESPESRFRLLLEERSAECRAAEEKINQLVQLGRTTTGLNDLLTSLIHMSINRSVVVQPRRHELVLYEFLFRSYMERLGRRKHRGKRN